VLVVRDARHGAAFATRGPAPILAGRSAKSGSCFRPRRSPLPKLARRGNRRRRAQPETSDRRREHSEASGRRNGSGRQNSLSWDRETLLRSGWASWSVLANAFRLARRLESPVRTYNLDSSWILAGIRRKHPIRSSSSRAGRNLTAAANGRSPLTRPFSAWSDCPTHTSAVGRFGFQCIPIARRMSSILKPCSASIRGLRSPSPAAG